jgi:hypothetical protein
LKWKNKNMHRTYLEIPYYFTYIPAIFYVL